MRDSAITELPPTEKLTGNNSAREVAVKPVEWIMSDPVGFKLRPNGKDLRPLADCLRKGSDRF
jgi:hypothetical protein